MSDRRRILVPPTARPLTFAPAPTESSQDSSSSSKTEIYLRTSLFPDASGSAYLEHQKHKILVLVNGPRPQRMSFSSTAKLLVDVKFLPVSSDAHVLGIQQGGGFDTDLEKSLADYIYASLVPAIRLERYPKSGISVSVVVVSGPPRWKGLVKQVTAACVTTAGAALVDAGIEVLDVVTACAVKVSKEGAVSLDLDETSEDSESVDTVARGVISSMASRDEITGVWVDDDTTSESASSRSIEGEALVAVLKAANSGAVEIRKLVNAVLARSLDELLVEKKGKKKITKRSAESMDS
ncbi:3' exoribonuclease family, domain 1-domain-containing protein [Myxozyma melibiosi]|uniref:3' exoribonuclease family, domain 1-domain-containing protein n=1 Tax=Myxozyma melibiosi TaxID=54550 RepID=A0ABR1FE82_9ASCO